MAVESALKSQEGKNLIDIKVENRHFKIMKISQ